jgi:hypothetical protein
MFKGGLVDLSLGGRVTTESRLWKKNQCFYGISVSPMTQGCQMVYFQTKNPNLSAFWRALDWKMLIFLRLVGIFYGHLGYLVHFVLICYFFLFWYHVCTKKNLADPVPKSDGKNGRRKTMDCVWICSRKHDALLQQSNLPKNDTIATKHYYVCS